MNVNFEYYRIFYYVAKYRNFTKAARVLGNSQPNITRAMNCLEQQVHATLFIRTNRGVQLTSEGEELYNYVSAAMIQIFAAEEALSENDGLLHGNIVIGTSETALNIFLVDQLKSFHQSYPGIRLKIYNYSTPQALEAVRSGANPELTTRQKHIRECFVVAKEGADKARIEAEIKNMPNYFADYDTTVHFISQEELDRDHSGIPHGRR